MSKYKKTRNVIYDLASRRVSRQKELSKKSAHYIHGNDPKIISAIIHNNRGKNNRYLIPKAVADSLVLAQVFKEDKEVYWGTDDEIRRYIPLLFTTLLLEIHESGSVEVRKELDRALIDYAPYAKWSAYYDICNDSTTNPALFVYGFNRDDIVESAANARKAATVKLYKHFLEDCNSTVGEKFLELFLDFTSEQNSHGDNKGFKFLDKRISKFVENKLIPLFQDASIDWSFGKRIEALIKEDVSQLDWILSAELASPEATMQFLTPNECCALDTARSLVAASEKYIADLEEIYTDFEGVICEAGVEHFMHEEHCGEIK